MAWRCELTGKTRQIGHRVSHSNRKTKRRFLPNLLNVTLMSDSLGRSVRLRISANALKSVDHRGGLDAFLLKAADAQLAPRMLDLKRQITKKRAQFARVPEWRRRMRNFHRGRSSSSGKSPRSALQQLKAPLSIKRDANIDWSLRRKFAGIGAPMQILR